MAEVRAEQQGDARNETAGRVAATASPGVAPTTAICPALDGSPVNGAPVNGAPANGAAINGTPSGSGTPLEGAPPNGTGVGTAAVEEPVIVEEPAAVEEPVIVEEPAAVEEPVVVEEPVAVEEPVVVESAASGEEPVAVEASMTRTRRGMLVRRLLAAGTALVVVALAVALGITAHSLSSKEAADSSRDAALAAARSDAIELSAYNYAHLDQDTAAVLSHSTPTFTKSYTQSIDTIKALLVKFKATASATVVGAGVESSSSSHVAVLIALDQVVTNTSKKGSTTEQSRLEMDMVRYRGHWAINQVVLLST